MLETYAEVDKSLADLNGNTAEFRLSEDRAFIEAMNQQMAQTLFYGDSSVNPQQFTEIMLPGVRNPTAAMRVQYEVGADTNGTGKLIYTDQPQAWLKYVSRVTDVNMFDAIFMEALAWRLAAAINMALTGNADLGTFALNMYNRVILSAGSHSQNESQEPQPPVDEFTIARLS